MRCSGCGAESPTTARFCAQCGAPLARACPRCGHDASQAARFCQECGEGLVGAPAGTPTPAPTPVSPAPQSYTPRHLAEKILATRSSLEGERKQITVLFADVVGSTELIQGLDPEASQRLLDGALRVMMDAVHRYEGTV